MIYVYQVLGNGLTKNGCNQNIFSFHYIFPCAWQVLKCTKLD